MLKTLLGNLAGKKEKAGCDLITFEWYVIAASFPKMLCRTDGGHIPKLYFDCLLSLELTTFKFIEQPDTETMGSKPKNSNPDQPFLSIIPSLKTETCIPNLRQTAEEIAKGLEVPLNMMIQFHDGMDHGITRSLRV